MRDRSAFVLYVPVRSIDRHSTKTVRTSIGTKALRSLVRDEFYWVASATASAALRDLISASLGLLSVETLGRQQVHLVRRLRRRMRMRDQNPGRVILLYLVAQQHQ